MVQQIELLQNQKCQTGDSKSFREKNNKTFSSSKSYQALTYETKSFHVKSTRSSREDYSKNQKSQNGNKFFVTQKDFKRRTNNKIFFFVEKSPGVHVQQHWQKRWPCICRQPKQWRKQTTILWQGCVFISLWRTSENAC